MSVSTGVWIIPLHFEVIQAQPWTKLGMNTVSVRLPVVQVLLCKLTRPIQELGLQAKIKSFVLVQMRRVFIYLKNLAAVIWLVSKLATSYTA